MVRLIIIVYLDGNVCTLIGRKPKANEMEEEIMACRKILLEETNKLDIIAHQVQEEFHAEIERISTRLLDPLGIFRDALGIKDWTELDSKYSE